MSPFNIIHNIFGKADKTISRMDQKTSRTIRSAFFMIIGILCIAGIAIGYKMGKSSAAIKSSPLARFTNEVFDIDMSREKSEGRFTDMIDSDLIDEARKENPSKVKFPSNERMDPDIDRGVIEVEKDVKRKSSPSLSEGDVILEGKYRSDTLKKGDVSPLKKDIKPFEDREDKITSDEKVKKLDDITDRSEKSDRDEPGVMKKKKGVLRNYKNPEPIKKEQGIIER